MPQASPPGSRLAVLAAAACALAFVGAAPWILPLGDNVSSVVEPALRHGLGAFAHADPERVFFRPLEYYANALALGAGLPWLVLVLDTAVVALFAVAVAALAHPDDSAAGAGWRRVTAALVLVHPLILPSGYRYDTLSQDLANLAGALGMLAVTRHPRTVLPLLAVHVLGLLSKESYAGFMLASSGLAIWQAWQARDARRAAALVLGCAVLVALYALARHALTNEALLAATPRYHLGLGANVISNLGLFLGGLVFFGSTADAAQGLSWSVLACGVVSVVVWTSLAAAVARGARGLPLRRAFGELLPLLLATVAALVPSVFANGISEQNASAFTGFALAFSLALGRRALDAVAERSPARSAALGAVALAVAACLAGSLAKLERMHAGSVQLASVMAAARAASSTDIQVRCEAGPRRPYSIYYLSRPALLDDARRLMHARGEIAPDADVNCAADSEPPLAAREPPGH